MKKNIIWIVLVLVLVGALFLFGGSSSSLSKDFKIGVLHPLDNIKGLASSSVVIMEYSDFECPACRSYYPIMRQLIAEFGDRVTFVYRHFPLNNIHPNAEFAARASQSAGVQGKFWEMHDILFEKQSEWASISDVMPLFESYAILLKLDLDKFIKDFNSNEIKDFVRSQRIHAIKSGIQGTPTFFINEKIIENPKSYQDFKKVILENL